MFQLLGGILYSCFEVVITILQRLFLVPPVILFLYLSILLVIVLSMSSTLYCKLKTIIQKSE